MTEKERSTKTEATRQTISTRLRPEIRQFLKGGGKGLLSAGEAIDIAISHLFEVPISTKGMTDPRKRFLYEADVSDIRDHIAINTENYQDH